MKLFLLDEVRTNNFTDPEVTQKINDLWEKAATCELEPKQPKYGVYFKYGSNYKDDYSFAVGTEYLETDRVIQSLPNVIYKVFPVDMKKKDPILSMWKKIWEWEDKGQLRRAYHFDFEKYLPNGEVDIYISVFS